MTKEQLQHLARLGVRQQLATFERILGALFKEFPEVFASETAPVLVKAELKAGGNDWPSFIATPAAAETNGNWHQTASANISASWTPERRAAQAHRMRLRAKKLGQVAGKPIRHGRHKAPAKVNKAVPWGTFTWQRMHDFLANQDGHRARTPDIMKAIDAKISPTVISAVSIHPELFKRVAPGEYALKKVLSPDEKV